MTYYIPSIPLYVVNILNQSKSMNTSLSDQKKENRLLIVLELLIVKIPIPKWWQSNHKSIENKSNVI